MSNMPLQKPGKSRQDYATPKEFLDIFQAKFGPIVHDLAAHEGNHVVDTWFGPDGVLGPRSEDSLAVDWTDWPRLLNGWCWLNPPYGNIKPWAKKCAESVAKCPDLRIAFLVPASVGSNWYRDWVHNKACVYALNPRLSFDGKNVFPKDLILALYGLEPKFDIWCWDK